MGRVLVVDDERTVRESLVLALEDEPWEVVAVASAEEALEVWKPGEWAALVADKNLPGLSGVGLIAAVREQDTAVGILMITGYGSVQTALDTLHLGVDGYLEKPFEDIFVVAREISETAATGERRQQSSVAASHFARASQHLRAIQKARALRVLIGAGAGAADWLRGRLDGADLEYATDPAQVLARVGGGDRDVVFVDAALTGSEPIAWIRQVREVGATVSLVVLTARPTFDVVTELIRLRVGAVLERPFTDHQFGQRIQPLLDRLRPAGPAR